MKNFSMKSLSWVYTGPYTVAPTMTGYFGASDSCTAPWERRAPPPGGSNLDAHRID